MLGDEVAINSVVGIGIIDYNIIVLISSQSQGVLYALYGFNGVISKPITRFWCSNVNTNWNANLTPLDLFTSHQGSLVFVQATCSIQADRVLSGYISSNRNNHHYVTLHFDLENSLTLAQTYSENFNSRTVTIRHAVSRSRLPNMVLITGDDSTAIVYSIEATFSNTINPSGGCVLTLKSHNRCIHCKGPFSLRLTDHTCHTCHQNNGRKAYCESSEVVTYRPDGGNYDVICKNAGAGDVDCMCEPIGHPHNIKYTKGKCMNGCEDGTMAIYKKNICLKKCPDGTIMTAHEEKNIVVDSSFSMEYLLKFEEGKTGLNVPVPDWIKKSTFPKAWTMTMWVWLIEPINEHYLVDAFNYIKLKRTQQLSGKGFMVLDIGSTAFSPSSTIVSMSNVLNSGSWNYIAISKGVEINGRDTEVMIMNMYVSTNTGSPDPLIFSVNDSPNVLPTNFKPYLVLGGAMNPDGITLSRVNSLTGYLTEFKFFGRFMNLDVLEAHQFHFHPPESTDLISYWRLAYQSSPGTVISDLHNSNLKVTMTNDKPQFETRAPNVGTLQLRLWRGFYHCIKFPWLGTPEITNGGDSWVFPTIVSAKAIYDDITNLHPSKANKFATGDLLYVTEGDCYLESNKAVALKSIVLVNNVNGQGVVANVVPSVVANVVEDNTKRFNNLIDGTSYRLCFKTIKYLTTHFLQWIYVARVPEASIPESIIAFIQWTNDVTFQTNGGDDSIDGVIYIAKSISAIKDNCEPPTAAPTCAVISPKEYRDDKTFSYKGTTEGLGLGRHNLYWRPLYSSKFERYVQIPNALLTRYANAPVYFSNPLCNS